MPQVSLSDVSARMPSKSRKNRRVIFSTALILGGTTWTAYDTFSEKAPVASTVERTASSETPKIVIEKSRAASKPGRSVRAFSSMQIASAQEKPYHGIIAAAAAKNRIDPALIRAVIHTESNFAPRARSRAGAKGLMQLMPKTGKQYGARRLYNAEENIKAGTAYLNALAKRFGETNHELIIAAYNAGEGTVTRYGGIPPYKETQDYVRRVTQRWGQANASAVTTVAVAQVPQGL